MSPRKPDILLSELAQQDLDDILQYTLETWGESQMDVYAEKLNDGFRLLQENPHLGRARNDWFPGCRCHHVEHHLVLYDVTEGALRVARIFHENREISRHLEPEQSRDQDRER